MCLDFFRIKYIILNFSLVYINWCDRANHVVAEDGCTMHNALRADHVHVPSRLALERSSSRVTSTMNTRRTNKSHKVRPGGIASIQLNALLSGSKRETPASYKIRPSLVPLIISFKPIGFAIFTGSQRDLCGQLSQAFARSSCMRDRDFRQGIIYLVRDWLKALIIESRDDIIQKSLGAWSWTS
jgi:hypothetical protein